MYSGLLSVWSFRLIYSDCFLWLSFSFTLLFFYSTMLYLYYYLTLLFFDSTIRLLYSSLTPLFFDSLILWLYYCLTLMFFYSTILWLCNLVRIQEVSQINFPWQCISKYLQQERVDFTQIEKKRLCKAEENTSKALQGKGAHWTLVRPGSWLGLDSKTNKETTHAQHVILIKSL